MKNIKIFIDTCKNEGVRQALVRGLATLLGVRIIGFYSKNKNEYLSEQCGIPQECVNVPQFTHSSIKRAMFVNVEEALSVVNTCFANVLVGYVSFMNALGYCRYEKRKKILEMVLEIQNNKEYRKHLEFAVLNQWEWEGPSEQLLARFDYCIKERTSNPDIWLAYISTLIEIKKETEAKIILESYCALYGTKNIHKFYPVAKFAVLHGIRNEKIDRAAYIFDVIIRNQNILERYLEGKKIAVVGSGPSELGKKNGEEIDSHDVVIRFNDFELEGYEIDYGKKTTVWLRNIDVENGGCKPRFNEVEKFDIIVLEADIWRFGIPEIFLDTFYRYAMADKSRLCMLKNRDNLISEMGTFPTSGALLLYNLLPMKGKNNIDIYGFSFMEDKEDLSKNLGHYNSSGYRESNLHHSLEIERKYLRTLWRK